MLYNILIADDHSVVRHGTKLLIEEMFDDVNVLEASSLKQITQLMKTNVFDLAILDINMPGGNTVQLVDAVKLKQPGIKILIFSTYDEKLYATRYLNAGANGYLHKHTSENELKKAIISVLEKGEYMSQSLTNLLTAPTDKSFKNNPISLLSNREIEVAELMAQGLGGVEISVKLNIETTTVSSHKKRVFEKLSVNNLAEFIDKFKQYSSHT